MIQYCAVVDINGNHRLRAMNSFSDMQTGDKLVTDSYPSTNMFSINIQYTINPCLIGFLNEVPGSVLICETQGLGGYYYFKCNDVVAMYDISWTLITIPGAIVKTLGYFWSSEPVLPGFASYNFNRITSGSCTCLVFSNCPRFMMARDTMPYASGMVSDRGVWSVEFFGLNNLPTLVDGGINIISTNTQNLPGQIYIIDNTNNNMSFTFGLSNILTSTITKTYTIAYMSSSTYTQMFGFTLTSTEGVKDVSSTTFALSTQFTFQESFSTTSTNSNTLTNTETVIVSGSIIVNPKCKLTITENFSNTLTIFSKSFLINGMDAQTTYNQNIIAPTGYTASSVCI